MSLFTAEMDYPKYKIIVNVVLGEQKGAGVSCASRCFWDADSDACVSNTFVNVSKSYGKMQFLFEMLCRLQDVRHAK